VNRHFAAGLDGTRDAICQEIEMAKFVFNRDER